jgi:ligand-binding sensor domain-containing protein
VIVEQPEEEEFCQVCTLPTTDPLCVQHIHIDVEGGVWLTAVDGSMVVIPAQWRKLAAKWVREGTYTR